MTRSLVRAFTGIAVVAALALTGLAAPASAQQADKGNTRVAVAPRVAKIVTNAGIEVNTFGGAKAFGYEGTLAVRFPISGTAGGGDRIKHVGGIRLSAGHASIKLSRFRINLDEGMVSARVNGDARAKVFKIAKSNRPMLGKVRLVFNKTSAGALNATFGVHVFKAGNNFGFATVNAK